jgi:hypothetical protein
MINSVKPMPRHSTLRRANALRPSRATSRACGGQTSSIRVGRTVPIALVRKTKPEIVAALDQLLDTCSDSLAAKRLNEMGYGNWRQEPFTYRKVRRLRRDYKLSSRYERLRARGLLTAEEVAQHLGVCIATVHHWGYQGVLRREIYGGHHCLYVLPDQRTLVKPTIGRPRKPAVRNDSST